MTSCENKELMSLVTLSFDMLSSWPMSLIWNPVLGKTSGFPRIPVKWHIVQGKYILGFHKI